MNTPPFTPALRHTGRRYGFDRCRRAHALRDQSPLFIAMALDVPVTDVTAIVEAGAWLAGEETAQPFTAPSHE